METNKREKKEFLLMEIEGAATWRATKYQEYLDDKRNLYSSEQLMELYAYIEALPEGHQLFSDQWSMDEMEAEWFNNRISHYGFYCDEDIGEFINKELLVKHFKRFDSN